MSSSLRQVRKDSLLSSIQWLASQGKPIDRQSLERESFDMANELVTEGKVKVRKKTVPTPGMEAWGATDNLELLYPADFVIRN